MSPTATTESAANRPHIWLWPLLVAALTFAVYIPSLDNDFTYDDRVFVRVPNVGGEPNQMVGKLQPLGRYFTSWYGEGSGAGSGRGLRPVTVLGFALTHAIAKDTESTPGQPVCAAFPHHVVNSLLHCLAAVLTYFLVALFLGHGLPAAVAAAIFGLHALRSDPVCSLVGRAEIQGFVFGAGALLLYVAGLRSRAGGRWLRLAPVPLLLFLSFGSKESAVPWAVFLPLTVMALRWQSTKHRDQLPGLTGQLLPAAICCLLPLIAFLVLFFNLQADLTSKGHNMHIGFAMNPLNHVGAMDRVASGVMILGYGLFKIFWPVHLACDYGSQVFTPANLVDPRFLLATVILGGLLFLGIRYARRAPLLFLAVATFFGFTFATSNIPLPIETIFGERLYYTPALCLSLAAAWWTAKLLDTKGASKPRVGSWQLWLRVSTGVLLAWLLLGSVRIVQRGSDWQDNGTLFLHDAETQPRSISMKLAAADFLRDANQTERHVQMLMDALEVDPEAPEVLNDLAVHYINVRQLDLADQYLRRAMASRNPDATEHMANFFMVMGNLQRTRGDRAAAEKWYRKAKEQNPRDPKYADELGKHYMSHANIDAAIAVYREMTQTTPRYMAAWERLLKTLFAKKAFQDYQATLQQLMKQAPNHAVTTVQVGMATYYQGQFDRAAALLGKGLANLPQAPTDLVTRAGQWQALADSLDRVGQRPQAIGIIRRLLSLQQLNPTRRARLIELAKRMGG